ncbi:hypothetical protein EDEG_01634 [Edhazardia aedis USNM 41457]|uniref:Uncharacterized protein n=1 Tax=Edhazardia aedis (strain USNM 41457) TaxID=1003232 RepID=J8ZWN1_EDHAE|nr:hypothetical protein EDEG_01634 [Edhazardia aedis USNM 41457]|eukprot:EJW04058.1 hypothetical protein EDEG_01634 [Edhazardia aedis USNM 41457]
MVYEDFEESVPSEKNSAVLDNHNDSEIIEKFKGLSEKEIFDDLKETERKKEIKNVKVVNSKISSVNFQDDDLQDKKNYNKAIERKKNNNTDKNKRKNTKISKKECEKNVCIPFKTTYENFSKSQNLSTNIEKNKTGVFAKTEGIKSLDNLKINKTETENEGYEEPQIYLRSIEKNNAGHLDKGLKISKKKLKMSKINEKSEGEGLSENSEKSNYINNSLTREPNIMIKKYMKSLENLRYDEMENYYSEYEEKKEEFAENSETARIYSKDEVNNSAQKGIGNLENCKIIDDVSKDKKNCRKKIESEIIKSPKINVIESEKKEDAPIMDNDSIIPKKNFEKNGKQNDEKTFFVVFDDEIKSEYNLEYIEGKNSDNEKNTEEMQTPHKKIIELLNETEFEKFQSSTEIVDSRESNNFDSKSLSSKFLSENSDFREFCVTGLHKEKDIKDIYYSEERTENAFEKIDDAVFNKFCDVDFCAVKIPDIVITKCSDVSIEIEKNEISSFSIESFEEEKIDESVHKLNSITTEEFQIENGEIDKNAREKSMEMLETNDYSFDTLKKKEKSAFKFNLENEKKEPESKLYGGEHEKHEKSIREKCIYNINIESESDKKSSKEKLKDVKINSYVDRCELFNKNDKESYIDKITDNFFVTEDFGMQLSEKKNNNRGLNITNICRIYKVLDDGNVEESNKVLGVEIEKNIQEDEKEAFKDFSSAVKNTDLRVDFLKGLINEKPESRDLMLKDEIIEKAENAPSNDDLKEDLNKYCSRSITEKEANDVEKKSPGDVKNDNLICKSDLNQSIEKTYDVALEGEVKINFNENSEKSLQEYSNDPERLFDAQVEISDIKQEENIIDNSYKSEDLKNYSKSNQRKKMRKNFQFNEDEVLAEMSDNKEMNVFDCSLEKKVIEVFDENFVKNDGKECDKMLELGEVKISNITTEEKNNGNFSENVKEKQKNKNIIYDSSSKENRIEELEKNIDQYALQSKKIFF